MPSILDRVAFITLTNTGYIDYTLNCLKSLELTGLKNTLHCYCIGEEGYIRLKDSGYTCTLIEDNTNSNFQEFRTGNWSQITATKFDIIYENLLKYDYVCITDGDITFHNPSIFDFLVTHINDNDNDMSIQLDTMVNHDYSNLCSGFMFIKSSEKTIELFNPSNVAPYKSVLGWDDQIYINSIKNNMKVSGLPLELFPNGQYYYKHHMNINPYMIHFNWVVGNEKKERMIKYSKWFL